MMQYSVFDSGEETYHVNGHSARTTIETLILCINQCLEKRRIDLVILHWRAVLVEELANQLAIGTVNLGGLVGWRIKNAREITRALAKQPKEVDVNGTKVNEDKGYE